MLKAPSGIATASCAECVSELLSVEVLTGNKKYCNGMADLGYTKLNGKICCNKCKDYVCGVRLLVTCASNLTFRSVTMSSTTPLSRSMESECIPAALHVLGARASSTQNPSAKSRYAGVTSVPLSLFFFQERPCCDSCIQKMKEAAKP